MVYAVITVTLIYMLSLLGSFIKKFICSDREGKLRLVKGYAKGRFVLIYVAAIPLFMLGALTNGDPFVKAFFAAVEASVDLVVLSYDYDISAALMAQNGYYLAVMIILFLLVVLNTAMFTLALCYQRGANAVYLKKATERSEKVYVVVGKNVKNRDILTSCEGAKILIAEDNQKDNELEEFCYLNKIALVKIKNDLSLKDVLNNLFKDLTACSINVIINTGSDSENLLFTEDISELINSIDLQKLAIDDVRGVHAYVFGEPENASAFLHFVKKTSGQIRYVNKYKLVALDFVDKYPLTAFMGEDEIDYDTATLKQNVDLNVAMVGYNKTMQELFVTSVANNQFMSIDADGKLVARPVRYSLFTKRNDKAASVSDKNLNHTYFRYAFAKSDMEKSGKYLPLPELPAKESFIPLDINDADFYQQVKESLSPQVEGHSTYNYLIVSYASDLENLDIAEKLYIKIKEWGIDKKTKLFVKIRDDKLANKIVKEEYNHLEGIITFATEKEVVYNLKQIVSENIETMARDRHLAYAVCDAIQDGNDENVVKTKALKKWYAWEQPQRDANVYGVLSIRMKLHLMGYDYAKGKENTDINEQFMEKYQNGDPISYKEGTISGKSIIEYNNNFVKGSLRERMAIQEHLRWNAYMITQGVIPSSTAQILDEGGKNLALRRHGCLTTFEGLLEYRRLLSERNGTDEETEDVIRYDYQLLDDLIWLLARHSNHLIKK